MKMTEIIKIYNFWNERNKCITKNKTPEILKRELLKEKGKKCYICSKEFESAYGLELEHKIPVAVGGKIFDKSNLDLACIRCHRKKTIVDKKVIKVIYDMGMVIKSINTSFYPLEEIRQEYLRMFNICLECKEKREKWYYGYPGQDFVQIFDSSNREVDDAAN